MRVEHFEQASYKYLVTLAVQAGEMRVSGQLEKNMNEEESAAAELDKIAEEIAQPGS